MNYNTAKVASLGRNDLERALVEVTERGMGEGNLGSRGKCKKKTYPNGRWMSPRWLARGTRPLSLGVLELS